MDVVLKGIGFGIILALSIGPVFFSLIQTSIEKGFGAGILMALGISISDSSFVILSYLGFSKLITTPRIEFYLELIGGSVLILLGIFSFFKRAKSSKPSRIRDGKGAIRAVAKGFIMNGVSPFVLIFWVGVMGYATIDYGFERMELRLFFVVVLITVLSADILKAYLSDKLRSLIRPRLINIMNGFVGLILIGFGIRLILFAV